ncbi:MAG: hypothetical protein D6723_03670 [Acidobacteria bacterium]|nr:MAG: hypothetical protein D6723_03670 [Acidobacteriota bacterium]
MTGERAVIYRFGEFVLDVSERQLRHGEQEIYLRPKIFEALVYLVERAGHIIEKNELKHALWPDTIVTESALTQSIKEIREVLRDDFHHPHYIQTIPRVGYKFIAEVEDITPSEITEEGEMEDEYGTIRIRVVEREDEQQRREQWANGPMNEAMLRAPPFSAHPSLPRSDWWTRRGRAIFAGLALLVLLVAVGLLLHGRKRPPIRSIAVLPFTYLGVDADREYFADGVTEALIADLSKLRTLRVISRTSVMQYKGARKTLPEIARELDVDALVEGSVLRSGSRVCITARLIRARREELMWADNYERDLSDILTLQRDVCRAIAQQIQKQLVPSKETSSPAVSSINPAAYEAYLKGRYYLNKRTDEGFRKGIEYFQRAIAREPNYALAYAGLADCYNLLNNYDVMLPRVAAPRAKAAARRALDIDDTLADAYASLGFTHTFYDWEWENAERAFRRAIALNPSCAPAHHWYGLYLAAKGRFEEAREELHQARELDPLSLIINANIGWVLYFERRYDQAIEACQKTLEMDAHFLSARIKLAWAYEQKGMSREAIAEFRQVLAHDETDPSFWALLGHAYAVAGRKTEAIQMIGEAKDRSARRYLSPYLIAIIYAELDERDRALKWLEKAYEDRSGWLVWLKVDPKLDRLRADPGFVEFLSRLGLDE